MDKILRALYDSFYTPPEMAELTGVVEANRMLLRERLAKEDRKIVLRIVDDMSMMALERSYDSFICGFKPAWRLANELNNYKENERSTPTGTVGLDARFVSEEGESI
jgi:hypothetical protein